MRAPRRLGLRIARGRTLLPVTEEQDQRRAAKTRKRLASVAAETNHSLDVCDGCEEPFDTEEDIRRVTIAGVFEQRFHRLCYEAWLDFRR
jgi:hypothetical protein